MWGAFLFAALYFPAIQIAPLYLWHDQEVLAALGLRTAGLVPACVLPLALTAALFAGQLVALAASLHAGPGGLWRQRTALSPPIKLRNWVAAPLLEEFIYRACLLSYLLAAGVGARAATWLSPLLFGASHLHHLYDRTRFQGQPPGQALRALAVQLAYTTVFGWLAAHFFLRTGHLAAAVLPHAFCNVVGPPALPPPGAPLRRAALAAHAAGIVAFCCLLRPLTEPALYARG